VEAALGLALASPATGTGFSPSATGEVQGTQSMQG